MTVPSASPDIPAESIMTWLQEDGANIALWIGVSVGVFLGLRFLAALLSGLLHHKDSRPSAWRNIVGDFVAAINSAFLAVTALVVTAPFCVELPASGGLLLQKLFVVVATLQVAFWARVFVKAFLEQITDTEDGDISTLDSARSLISAFANIVIFSLAAITILDNLGQDITALIAGLGVGGLAIGLAAQNIFQDLFASLSIVLDRPFVNGDFIEFDGFSGTVESVGLKTTRLKALSGEQLVVSNANLLDNEIQNYKRMAERRIGFTLGVTYQTPRTALEAIPARLEAIINARPHCRFDRCHLAAFGDSAIEFATVYYVQSPDYAVYMDEQQAIYLDIHRAFEELGADFAYPTQTLMIEKAA